MGSGWPRSSPPAGSARNLLQTAATRTQDAARRGAEVPLARRRAANRRDLRPRHHRADGARFYDAVFVPAIAEARAEGKSYETIRDTIRKGWKPARAESWPRVSRPRADRSLCGGCSHRRIPTQQMNKGDRPARCTLRQRSTALRHEVADECREDR